MNLYFILIPIPTETGPNNEYLLVVFPDETLARQLSSPSSFPHPPPGEIHGPAAERKTRSCR